MKIISITKDNLDQFASCLVPFGNIGNAILLGTMTEKEEAAGAAAFLRYDGWAELIYIYVLPAYRRQGVGSSLLHMAGGHVEALKGLPVTADFSGSTEGLRALFEAEGYYICRGKSFYEFSLKDAVRLFPEKQRELPGGIRPLSGLRSGEISELKDFIESFGWSADLLNPEIVREEYSFVGFADGRVSGLLLTSGEGEMTFRIDTVATAIGNRRMFSALFSGMIYSMRRAEKAGTVIRFFGENERLVETASKMLGNSLRMTEDFYIAVG